MDPAGNAPKSEDDHAEAPAGGAPLVFIPVTAEDVARRKRRMVLSVSAATLAVLLLIAYLYKRSVDPLHARQSYDSGVRMLALARYPQAILAFSRAVALEPDFADAYLLRGEANAADGKIDRAIADFSKTLDLRPDNTQALLRRGLAWAELKDFPAAISDANQALAVDPNFAPAYNLRGVGVRGLGDPRKALDDFTRAIALAPNTDSYYQRGATYQMLGDHRRAVADFDQVIAIQPDAAPGYFARAESRRALGDLRGAEQDHLQGRILDGR